MPALDNISLLVPKATHFGARQQSLREAKPIVEKAVEP